MLILNYFDLEQNVSCLQLEIISLKLQLNKMALTSSEKTWSSNQNIQQIEVHI